MTAVISGGRPGGDNGAVPPANERSFSLAERFRFDAMLAPAYFLETPGRPLVRRDLEAPEPGPGEALVEVAACGLCHTDLAFADGSVAPRHPLPLVLGHEVTGRVVAAGEDAGAPGGPP